MEPVPLAARVVEVIADCGESADSRYRYGSGCIVVGRIVLTAAHVVVGSEKVQVRDANKVMYGATVDERFVGDAVGPGPDLALVELETSTVDAPAMALGMVDRESPEAEPVERCQAVGYPWFAERPSPEVVRDTVDAFGHVRVLSKLVSGLLSLHVSGAPRPLPQESASLVASEWSGMSGAPLVAAGCLLGVVTEHAAREGPSTITVTPLTALEADPAHPNWGPDVSNPASWWSRLGIAGPAALRRLPARRVRPEPAYRATIREIQTRTPELRDRERELRDIAAFATSSHGYGWVLGGPWTGKTALVATALVALPERVDSVSYFLSRREADADSNHFLSAIVPQLADLLDRDPPPAPSPGEFRKLWQLAAVAAGAAGRHLLLVVDGLDEDLHPPGSPSVTSLLPVFTGESAHVLVTSRHHPDLESELPVDHPLLLAPHTELSPFTGAPELAAVARREIDELKYRDDDGLAADILAILAAAAGPLTVEDLAMITAGPTPSGPRHAQQVLLVTKAAARSLEAVGEPPSYRFAHESLLEYAQSDPYLSHPDYRQRVHRWAEEWADAGWSAGGASAAVTPRYLLEAYPATLAGDWEHPGGRDELERLANLVTDIGWVDSAVARVGVDAVLVSLRTAEGRCGRARVGPVLRLLEDQAQHLRHPDARNRIGYAATELTWRALALGGVDDVVTSASDRLWRLPAPQLIPVWTSERVSRNLVSALGHHGGTVWALAVTGGGLVVSGGEDGNVRLWDPRAPGDRGRELGRHDGRVRAVAVTGEGLVVSGGSDGMLWLWDPETPDDRGRELGHHDDGVMAVAVSGEGQVVSGGSDEMVRVWDPRTPGDPGRELGRPHGSVYAMAVTGRGR